MTTRTGAERELSFTDDPSMTYAATCSVCGPDDSFGSGHVHAKPAAPAVSLQVTPVISVRLPSTYIA
jgi:hypothetical protein